MNRILRSEHLIIPSSIDQIERVDNFVESLASTLGFGHDALADIGICVTELVMNAIVHAHKENATIPVDIDVVCCDEGLRVSIRDYGPGFETNHVPDPTSPERLFDDHGRGILIVKTMMDDVKCDRLADGMKIEIFKKLDPTST